MYDPNVQVERTNLCTYFLLPLTGVNKSTFGEYRFRQCWLSRNHKELIVSANKGVNQIIEKDLQKNQNYTWYSHVAGIDYFCLQIPEQFTKEVARFLNGKYSKFSEESISIIEKNSTLKFNYEVPGDDSIVTDRKLLALKLSKVLKESLENDIGVHLSDDAELLDKPNLEAEYLPANLQF